MTTPTPATLFADPASEDRLERAASALTAHGFAAEVLDDAAAARIRIKNLIPEGASVMTGASETLRLSGIDEDINTSGRYQVIRPRLLAMDRVAEADEFRRLLTSPEPARQNADQGIRLVPDARTATAVGLRRFVDRTGHWLELGLRFEARRRVSGRRAHQRRPCDVRSDAADW